MDLKIKGKLALVCGSTAGIGFAIASQLAAEGARVIVNGRSQEAVDGAAAKIEAADGGEALGFAGDLGTPEAAQAVVAQFPGIEILVNNLGIFEAKRFEEPPEIAAMVAYLASPVSSGTTGAALRVDGGGTKSAS